jgi:hypothetical protein
MPWLIELKALPGILRWPARKLHSVLILPVLQILSVTGSMSVTAQPLGIQQPPPLNKQCAALSVMARCSMPWLTELLALPVILRWPAHKLHPLLFLPVLKDYSVPGSMSVAA